MALSFRGGICPEEKKETAQSPIERISQPSKVRLALNQHIGQPAVPVVAVGQRVLKGQLVAAAQEECGAPVHSSVSGTVAAIENGATPRGEGMLIVVENDFREEEAPDLKPFGTPIFRAEPEELTAWIRDKGIVGLGGAAFPTWMKIESARGKVKTVVINGAESEPYLTANHRLLLEYPDEIIGGVKILMRAVGAQNAIFAVEDNKLDAAQKLMRAFGKSTQMEAVILKTKYPQGDERQLIRTLFKKEIPKGKLPFDVGAVVFNVETCRAVYRAFVTGMPMIERVVTVSGECVKDPSNLLVPVGTPFSDLFKGCGGFLKKPDRIIAGGALTGAALQTLDTPVTKGLGGALALCAKLSPAESCIHCGRCLRACPMHLVPTVLYRAVQKEDAAEMERYSITSCSECGCCSYVCPAKIPLLQNIRIGKEMLRAESEPK